MLSKVCVIGFSAEQSGAVQFFLTICPSWKSAPKRDAHWQDLPIRKMHPKGYKEVRVTKSLVYMVLFIVPAKIDLKFPHFVA